MMTFSFTLMGDASYSVTHANGCCVIAGAPPVNEFCALVNCWTVAADKGTPNEWYCDGVLADHLDVTLVCGPRHATAAWRDFLGLEVPAEKPTESPP
jgi:hypothetical protein